MTPGPVTPARAASGWRWLWLAAVVVVLDQATKAMASAWLSLHVPVPVLPGFNFTLTHNPGAAFSLFSQASGWQRWFFLALAVGVGGYILWWLRRAPARPAWLPVALCLVLGGAAGNAIDRALHGYVIDFIDWYVGTRHWPAFNIADSAISIGAVMLLIDAVRPRRPDQRSDS